MARRAHIKRWRTAGDEAPPLPPERGTRRSEEISGLQTASSTVIYRHVFENADREVGGVLIGRVAGDGGLPLVTGAIPAIRADERRATLTFTQEAWAHVHHVLESEFPPDEQIVGWYHSHPGFGIFLSGHDLFIHEHFFSAPSQIAVVVDPHAQREGAFVWRERELIPLFERPTPSGWFVSSPVGPQLAHHGGALRIAAAADPAKPGLPVLALVIAGVIGVAIGFGLWSVAEGVGGSAHKPSAAKAQRARPILAPKPTIEVHE
jgi:proteasome lid subunit RPN8/RPN11